MGLLRKGSGGARTKRSGWLVPAVVFLATASLSALTLGHFVVLAHARSGGAFNFGRRGRDALGIAGKMPVLQKQY